MRKKIAAFLITSLLASCSGNEAGTSSNTSAITGMDGTEEWAPDAGVGDTPTDETLTDETAIDEDEVYVTDLELMDQADVDANADSYSWLVEGTETITTAVDSVCAGGASCAAQQPITLVTATADYAFRIMEPFMPVETTTPIETETECSMMLGDGKSVTIRKLLWRFLKNKWSKLAKTGDEAAGNALNKLMTSPGLKKEAKDALDAAVKANPKSATGALKGFMEWVKKQPKSKLALGVLGIAITAGALPFVLDELKDALKKHILGIETQDEKIKKLEKEVEALKAKIKDGCSDAEPNTPDDDVLKQLEAKLDELEAAIKEFDKLEEELEEELDAIEKALGDIGLDKIEPDPS